MSTKLLIFDLDGTLCDTNPILHMIVYESLIDSGIEIESPKAVKKSIKIHGSEVFRSAPMPCEFLPMLDREKYADDFWRNYERHFMESVDRVFYGMKEALSELKKRGYILTVLSNKKDQYVQPIIKTAFGDLFTLIVGRSEERPKKPAPDGIFYICGQLGVEPENTYMIGDLAADYLASKNAGCNHIIANWGYGHEKGLRRHGATVFAEKPLDLLNILK